MSILLLLSFDLSTTGHGKKINFFKTIIIITTLMSNFETSDTF